LAPVIQSPLINFWFENKPSGNPGSRVKADLQEHGNRIRVFFFFDSVVKQLDSVESMK
jgi:hypothetical protein